VTLMLAFAAVVGSLASCVTTGSRPTPVWPGRSAAASIALRGHGRALLSGVPSQLVGEPRSPSGPIGLYATATGSLIRAFPGTGNDEVLGLSGDGRTLYLSDFTGSRKCSRAVSLRSGRSRRLSFCATGLAVSPDDRMLAYTSLSHRGRVVTLVIRDTVTDRHRSVVIASNILHCGNCLTGAALAWSPDDHHIAVSVPYTASIESLSVMNAWHGGLAAAPTVARCDGEHRSCSSPGYDTDGRLLFTNSGRTWQRTG
jgi:hypothetical protein